MSNLEETSVACLERDRPVEIVKDLRASFCFSMSDFMYETIEVRPLIIITDPLTDVFMSSELMELYASFKKI